LYDDLASNIFIVYCILKFNFVSFSLFVIYFGINNENIFTQMIARNLCEGKYYMPVWNTVGRCGGSSPSQAEKWGSWLTCEPKPVYEVGFIREKGKATAREVQQSPETSGSLLRW
jgi:hypothetical protein